jgi:hypothetical protein
VWTQSHGAAHSVRRVVLEPLEPRTFLSGVTLIAHGLETSAGLPGWLVDMGKAVEARTPDGGPVSFYTLTVTGNWSELSITHGPLVGPDPRSSPNGEIVLLLDWSAVASVRHYTPTGSVAKVVHDALVSPTFIHELGGPLAALPMDLIGHSRGGSLVADIARRLGQDGIWVDQVTTLDPHPGPLDAPVDVTTNVRFADNYWRGDPGDLIIPNGTPVTGAHNVHLDDSVITTPGYFDPHNNTHLWYHGTIDLSPDASQDGHKIGDDWYDGDMGPRDQMGFYFTRLGRGDRTIGAADGLASMGAPRTEVTLDQSGSHVWDNIEITNDLADQNVSNGSAVDLHTNFQDLNGDATIRLGFDTDENPYDGVTTVKQEYGPGVLSGGTADIPLLTTGLAGGTYYPYAEITNGTHTRFYYGAGAVTVTALQHPEAYVQQLYQDLLHRDADPSGLATWVGKLNAGAPLTEVSIGITSSREYQAGIVDGFYVQYLGRHADPAGLDDWVNQMQSGLNAEVIRAGILASDEYYARVGGTHEAYVTALYHDLLGRAPDPAGYADWLGKLNAGASREEIASGINDSDETRTIVITGYYQDFLHRDPDPAGLETWINNLESGMSQPDIITAFVTSPEYLMLHSIT